MNKDYCIPQSNTLLPQVQLSRCRGLGRLFLGMTISLSGLCVEGAGHHLWAASSALNSSLAANSTSFALPHGLALGLNIILVTFGAIGIWWILDRQLKKRLQAEKTHVAQLQTQLIEMGKLASMGELAAAVAHEINNPLSIMMENSGWIQDLLDTEDVTKADTREEIEASLKTIITQGHRCREITQKLLSFARKPETSQQILSINAFLEDIIGYARQKLKHSKIKVLDELSPGAGHVLASPAELQQVVLNLVNNAADALDSQEGHIRIRSSSTSHQVQILIQDSGPGMPEAVLSQIFEPFYTTKPKGKGTGLGLSICRDLIERMGGEIKVQSSPEKGTSFFVRLPKHDHDSSCTMQENT
ncbi:MAG: HAMP domain-containing histidine kinase [Desulfovibrionales bacterium]|nr:HAMP domain-containing histidine kinase [Desulfovibrionales bacterium]